MYFGTTPFSAAAFSDVGFNPNAFVSVQSTRLNLTIGNISVTAPLDVTVIGKANVTLSGNRVNISIGDPTIKANATVVISGNRMNISTTAFGTGNFNVVGKANIATTGSRLNVANNTVEFRIWTQVDPNANQNWTNI